MATRAQKAVTLLNWCQEQASDLRSSYPQDVYDTWYTFGRYTLLEEMVRFLNTISKMKPGLIHSHIERLLDHFTEKKCNWMIHIRNRSSSLKLSPEGEAEGAIRQIDALIPELWELLSPQWRKTEKKYGNFFSVYHWIKNYQDILDIQKCWWCSQERSQFYEEVAILKAPLEEVFSLTSQQDTSWEHHHEVLWFRPDIPLRSIGRGDVIVSLASGASWVVSHEGLKLITEYNAVQKQAIAACLMVTQCFFILYDPDGECDHEGMDLWFEMCSVEAGTDEFFEALEAEPRWVGSQLRGEYRLTDKQLTLIGRRDPDDCNIPDLDGWERFYAQDERGATSYEIGRG
jgi:hypothetical protein